MSYHNTLILIVALLLAIVALAVLQANERSRRTADAFSASYQTRQATSGSNSSDLYSSVSSSSDL